MDGPSNPSIGNGAGVRTDCCYMCGFASCGKSLLTCKMCSCRIHVYCYISFCTFALKDIDRDEWVCEYCQPPNFTCSPKPAASKFAMGSVKPKRPVRRIPEDEVIALQAGSLTLEGIGPLTPPEKPFMKDSVKAKGICETSRQTCGFRVSNQETEKNTEDNLHPPSSINPPEPAPYVLTSSPIPASSLGQDHNIEQHVHMEVPFSLADPSPEPQSCKEHTDSRTAVAQGVDLCTNKLKASTNPVEQSLEDAQVRIDGCLPNPPFQRAAWKGSFTITASEFGASAESCDKIWGYLPVKTSMKALEFSKKMPNFLYFNVVRRDIIWANMFAEEGPDKDDIGLYFLPPDMRSEQGYSCLVSLLEKFDAVIQCHVNEVQLLVFTSRHLDDKSQKINGAYYLWGLFVPPDAAFKELPQILSARVKAEQFDKNDLGPPPGFAPRPLRADPPEPELSAPPGFAPRPLMADPPEPELSAPPGFAGVKPRVKYRSIGDLLQNS